MKDKMTRALLLVVLTFASQGCAMYGLDKWTTTDKWVLAGSVVCHSADAYLTNKILALPAWTEADGRHEYYESMPGIGKHPNELTTDTAALVFTADTALLGALTPNDRAGDRALVMALATLPCMIAVVGNYHDLHSAHGDQP